jgi:hypothetical protein
MEAMDRDEFERSLMAANRELKRELAVQTALADLFLAALTLERTRTSLAAWAESEAHVDAFAPLYEQLLFWEARYDACLQKVADVRVA